MNEKLQWIKIKPQRTQRARSSRAHSFLCVPPCPLWLTKFSQAENQKLLEGWQ